MEEFGSVFVAYGQGRRERVEILGETRTYNRRSFCQICGSSLFEAYPDFIEIRIGSLGEAPSAIGAPERETRLSGANIGYVP